MQRDLLPEYVLCMQCISIVNIFYVDIILLVQPQNEPRSRVFRSEGQFLCCSSSHQKPKHESEAGHWSSRQEIDLQENK